MISQRPGKTTPITITTGRDTNEFNKFMISNVNFTISVRNMKIFNIDLKRQSRTMITRGFPFIRRTPGSKSRPFQTSRHRRNQSPSSFTNRKTGNNLRNQAVFRGPNRSPNRKVRSLGNFKLSCHHNGRESRPRRESRLRVITFITKNIRRIMGGLILLVPRIGDPVTRIIRNVNGMRGVLRGLTNGVLVNKINFHRLRNRFRRVRTMRTRPTHPIELL